MMMMQNATYIPSAPALLIDNQCPDNQWLLYGTLGCHLCDMAEDLLNQFVSVYPIGYTKVDIINLADEQMQHWATKIPIFIVKNNQRIIATLAYPFSLADLVSFYQQVSIGNIVYVS